MIAALAAIRAPFRRANGAKKDSGRAAKQPEEGIMKSVSSDRAKKDSAQAAKQPEEGTVASGSSDDAGNKRPAPDKEFPNSVKIAAWAYFGLLIAALAALGIQGDVLIRLLRNEPQALGWAVVATLVGGAAAAIALLWPELTATRAVLAIGAALAMVGVGWAVIVGTASLSYREKPSLDLSVVPKGANTVTVTVDAAASSMRTKETLLLRLIAFTDSASEDPEWAEQRCLADTARSQDYVLLYFGDTGVTMAGVASTQWKGDVETNSANGEIRYICATAAISPREEPGQRPELQDLRARQVWAISDLALVPSTSPPPTGEGR